MTNLIDKAHENRPLPFVYSFNASTGDVLTLDAMLVWICFPSCTAIHSRFAEVTLDSPR